MFTKQLLIFSVAWMGTRDIYIAITITAAFVILADYAFNENSKFCIMPESYKKISSAMDLNNDGILTDDEINKSIKILEKARKCKILNFKKKLINNSKMEKNIKLSIQLILLVLVLVLLALILLIMLLLI